MQAVKLASKRRANAIPVGPSAPARKAEDRGSAPARKPQLVPIVRVKATRVAQDKSTAAPGAVDIADTARRKEAVMPTAKRTKAAEGLEVPTGGQKTRHANVAEDEHAGLDSLLGGYDSNSDSH